MLHEDQLVQFDSLAVHKKYNDVFDAKDVPDTERLAAAKQVADSLLLSMERG